MKSTENEIGQVNGVAATKAAAPKALKTREQREQEAIETMRVVTGTRSHHAAGRLTIQACHALVWPPVDNNAAIVAGVAAMAEMAPTQRNRRDAGGADDRGAQCGAHVSEPRDDQRTAPGRHRFQCDPGNAVMRLFLEQVEAMQKLQGKTGQQKVVVEHVHVNEGGQAIVGAVAAAKATVGEGSKRCRSRDPMTGRVDNFTLAPRCGARNRRGLPCQCPAMANGRSRLHGGLSTGPKTAEGIERIRRA